MDSGIYHELTPWYLLLDAREDHEEEAQDYAEIFTRVVRPEPRTLLELGAGAGNNGFYLKRHFHCTLSDLSTPMLELSREVNPECDHVQGDMRTLRLGQTFDAVLIHDAVVYMTTEAELSAAIRLFEEMKPLERRAVLDTLVADHGIECRNMSEGKRGRPRMAWFMP